VITVITLGGAFVQADRGICLIDEIDKMNDYNRVSIHEAMEQQTISISKAGIVAQLQARCAVIATANPLGGWFNSSKSLRENIELSDPILSRFDITCILKDSNDPVNDGMLANFVLDSHLLMASNSCSSQERLLISPEVLRKYISYAKSHFKPTICSSEDERIAKVYAKLRKESILHAGIPFAVRHLESIVRLSEAHALMHLRESVSSDDVSVAIRVMVENFIATQKQGAQHYLLLRFKEYITYKVDFSDLCLFLLRRLLRNKIEKENQVRIDVKDLLSEAKKYGVLTVDAFLTSTVFNESGFWLSDDSSFIVYEF
jgi:DNA replication licensing factor MCM2